MRAPFLIVLPVAAIFATAEPAAEAAPAPVLQQMTQQEKDAKREERKAKRQADRGDRPQQSREMREKQKQNSRTVDRSGGSSRTFTRRLGRDIDKFKNLGPDKQRWLETPLPKENTSAERRKLREAEHQRRLEIFRQRQAENNAAAADVETEEQRTGPRKPENGNIPTNRGRHMASNEKGSTSKETAAEAEVILEDHQINDVAAELKKHREREARLRRLLELAARDHDRTVEIESLRSLEKRRHQQVIADWKRSWGASTYDRAAAIALSRS